jgi:hypothetical protein
VIVARGDVGDERAEDIERRAVADPFLEAHVHLDLVERHVARAFDHDLDAGLSRALDQLAQGQQLLDLRPVGRVEYGTRSEPVPQAERHVVAMSDLEKAIEPGIEGVLFPVVEHPGDEESPAAGNDVGDPALLLEAFDGLQGQAAVDGHEIDALAGLRIDRFEQIVLGHVDDGLAAFDGLDGGLVDGDGPQGDGRPGQNGLADLLQVSARAQVHQGVGPVLQADPDLAQLVGEERKIAGGAEIDVDLGPQPPADP